MNEPVPPSGGRDPSLSLQVPSDGPLIERISALIEQTRAMVATTANAALTLMYWRIGRMIDVDVLSEKRADYDQEIVASLEPQLTARFGRGFDRSSLHRMVKFSQVFPDVEIVASLGQQLSWTHFKALLPVASAEARQFYIDQALAARLSVRGLRELIGRHRYERRDDEGAPIGLILCTEASREQVEMLEMHKDGIVVAEYWTDLPPKAELEARIQAIYREAAERVARQELPPTRDNG